MWDSRQTNTISGRTRTGVFAWFFNQAVGQHTAAPTDLIAQSLKHVFQKSMDRPSILREFEGSGRFTRLYGMRVIVDCRLSIFEDLGAGALSSFNTAAKDGD